MVCGVAGSSEVSKFGLAMEWEMAGGFMVFASLLRLWLLQKFN
jgi:hypothetical protein